MFITKKHLSRRTLLKGGTAAIGLPLLSAMVPAATALAQTVAAPKPRMGFFYLPHGAIMNNTRFGAEMNRWTPDVVGRDFDLKPILTPFAPLKKYLTVVSGLGNKPAESSAVHAIVPATWLSCEHPRQSHAPFGGVTIDQIAAHHIGQDTPLPSLEVASETTAQAAACPSGAGCYYSTTLSFRNAMTPLPMEFNPRKVFTQLFGEGDTDAERAAITGQTRSLLDLIADRTAALQKRVGASDRIVLDEYLSTVREIERRVENAAQRDLSAFTLPEAPIGELDSFDEQVKLMFELIALAYQANLTRVASYIMVAEGTNRTYNHIGVSDAFHPLSHHANDRDKLLRLARIQKYHVERFADFVAKLAAIPDGDGSLLDHSLFMYGSNMSNSDRHNNYPLPNVLVGGANGWLKGGQQVELPEHTPLTNLLLTVLNKAGLEMPSFADSTGEIAGV